MLDNIDQNVLFHEMHRAIEETATTCVRQLAIGAASTTYPPNCGFNADEMAALRSVRWTPALESAFRKLVADAAAYPLFHLLCLADGVVDVPEVDVAPADNGNLGLPLHDRLYDSYWAWRRRRPDPGWCLDTFDG